MSLLMIVAMVLGGMTTVSLLLVVATMRSSQLSELDPYCAEDFSQLRVPVSEPRERDLSDRRFVPG